jgi:hypothetical protein
MNVTLFIIGVTLLTLYGLTVSGHFPFEARKNELRTFMGTLVISATILSSGVAAIILIVVSSSAVAAPCLPFLCCCAFFLMISLTE